MRHIMRGLGHIHHLLKAMGNQHKHMHTVEGEEGERVKTEWKMRGRWGEEQDRRNEEEVEKCKAYAREIWSRQIWIRQEWEEWEGKRWRVMSLSPWPPPLCFTPISPPPSASCPTWLQVNSRIPASHVHFAAAPQSFSLSKLRQNLRITWSYSFYSYSTLLSNLG